MIIRLLPVAAMLLTACGERPSGSETAGDANGAALEAFFLDEAPADPQSIHVARVAAQPGDTLVLSGRVMGAAEPFVSGRAAFILGDPEKLTACNDRPGDECETPWDNCCDSKELLREGTATIQVVGEDGRVLKTGLEGRHGLEKLSRVVVEGTVAEGSTSDALVLNATGIWVR